MPQPPIHFLLGEATLSAGLAMQMVRGELKGTFSNAAQKGIQESARYVEQIVEHGDPVYGINTGFGPGSVVTA